MMVGAPMCYAAGSSQDAWSSRPSTTSFTASAGYLKQQLCETTERNSGEYNFDGDGQVAMTPSTIYERVDQLRTADNNSTTAPANGAFGFSHRTRSKAVGPMSFARAERPSVSDEPTRREESYGKQIVRLITRKGDVVVTVNRRRTSDWGSNQDGTRPPGYERAGNTAIHCGNVNEGRRDVLSQRQKSHVSDRENGQQYSFRHSPRRQEQGPLSIRRAEPNSPQMEAVKLLPDELSQALTSFREPGRAELPVIFRATTAPIYPVVHYKPPRSKTRNTRIPSPQRTDVDGDVHDSMMSESIDNTGSESRALTTLPSGHGEAIDSAKLVAAAEAVVTGTTGYTRLPT